MKDEHKLSNTHTQKYGSRVVYQRLFVVFVCLKKAAHMRTAHMYHTQKLCVSVLSQFVMIVCSLSKDIVRLSKNG